MAQPQFDDTKHNALASEEGESLTSKIPRREGWWRPLFLFQGSWITPQVLNSAMLVQAQFKPRADDIILATYPKSGTTWLKALTFVLANRSRHPVTGNEHPVLTQHPQDLVPFLELPDRALHPVEELEALPSPRLLCTHLPYALLPPAVTSSAIGCPIVYLCREPKDVVVSMWHYVNKHYLGYWKQNVIDPSRVLFLKYDEMMADPTKHVKIIAEFLRVPFSEDEENAGVPDEVVRLCSFQNLKGLPVNSTGKVDRVGGLPMENSSFFRSGKVGDWRNHLTKEMANKLDCIVQEKLKGSVLRGSASVSSPPRSRARIAHSLSRKAAVIHQHKRRRSRSPCAWHNATAFSTTWDKKKIQVTLCLAHPPRVSYIYVFCPGLYHTEFPLEPKILATEEDLVLLRIIVSSQENILKDTDYYIY
ncbi:hypothetical protein PR202_ga21481 [Eleusine coracana subsp. coracana]|uniref:Sulfotransferase n=1 Tax=Eleusine coracana subsp. coracana TaxID=191504 RepID=A0AAV5D0Z4_ELECO|nr:hypothetical protein PR202_ga21481 [Eleusine coracana subsp. coracana]